MKGWLYVISNKAVKGLVKMGGTAKDPVAYAESLDRAGLPYPYAVGYDALVPDLEGAERLVAETLAGKAEGKGWYACSVAEAVREITAVVGSSILIENRYDRESVTDKFAEEISSPDPDRRTAVLSDPNCPLNVLRFAAEREEDEAVLLKMLANPACLGLGDGLRDLVDRLPECSAMLAAIAANPKMPPSVLEDVFETTDDTETVLDLIRNPSFPLSIFPDVLSVHPHDEDILQAIVARQDCGPEILATLVWINSLDEHIHIRDIAKRHSLWSFDYFHSVLLREAQESPEIVASHPDCPSSLLAKLWRESDSYDVHKAVLANASCTAGILVAAALAGDEPDIDKAVAELAEVTMSNVLAVDEYDIGKAVTELAEVAMSNRSNPLALAGMTDATVDELGSLSRSEIPQVVVAVALNPNCPADLLIKLSGSSWETVRAAVAARDDCPEETLRKLATDGAPKVRSNTVSNSSCPVDVLEHYAADELVEWRLIVAKNRSCPEHIVDLLSGDSELSVRVTAMLKKYPRKQRKQKPAPVEPLEVVQERFRQVVRRTLGAVIEETELLRLSALPAEEREAFTKGFPSHAKQLALFEKYLLPKLRP